MYLIFNHMDICMSVCGYVHMGAGICRQEALDPLEPEL